MRENTEWHVLSCSASSRKWRANTCVRRTGLHRGQLRRNWQDDAGVTRYVTEVLVGQNGTLQMLGGRRESGVPESAAQPQVLPPRHNLLPHSRAQPQLNPPKAGGKKAVRMPPRLSNRLSLSRMISHHQWMMTRPFKPG
jgi:single-strand DNA-binding protein